MENIIITIILLAIVGLAAGYVIKAKKSGKKCIGCPSSGSCCSKKNNGSSCSCGCSSCHND